MHDRETRRYDKFTREVAFGTANAADFPTGSQGKTRFANLAQIIADLDAAKAGQQGGGNTAKSVLLDALRLDVLNLRRTAVALDQDEPGLADQLPALPSGSDADLLTTADHYLGELVEAATDDDPTKAAKTALRAKFIALELPADFATHLQDDRQAITDADTVQEGDREDAVASTSAVGRLIKEGMKQSVYLDALVRNKYTRDPDKTRAWESASHLERAPQRPPPANPPPPPPPA